MFTVQNKRISKSILIKEFENSRKEKGDKKKKL